MQTMTTTYPSTILRHRILWISLFAVLTGISAWIKIPLGFTPVPITLQTVVVLLSGVVLGRDGLWSQVAYLVLGGIGLPFFASNLPGVQVLFGATGGYLLGFVAASAFVGYVLRPQWNSMTFWKKLGWLLLSSMLIFLPGVIQLALFTGYPIGKVLTLGFYPFLLGDVIKCALVSWTPQKWTR